MTDPLRAMPHLTSPGHLAVADTGGKWRAVSHLAAVDRALVRAWRTPNARLAVNIPFQHGKSWLASIYFPAWVLLRWPDTRVALASYSDAYACGFGGKVRDVVDRFGPALGVCLRDDTSAKGEWVIDKHGGGMVCRGRGGALQGRPADLLILDDLIKDQEEAQSPTILDGIWDWYVTVAYSRLGPTAPVIAVGTRWGPKDLFGRWRAEERVGGEAFEFLVFKAIAEDADDPTNRQRGEALWPDRVPLARLQQVARTRPRWFRACWQQSPQETEGLHFQPRKWPTYTDVGDAWRVYGALAWSHYRKADCTILVAVDWARAGKRDSDRTAIVTAAWTGDGRLLILDVFCERLRYEENGPALDEVCRKWGVLSFKDGAGQGPDLIVASDDDTLSDAMALECRRYSAIPEVKRLAIRNKAKIVRAQAAIIRSQGGLFLWPDPEKPWFAEAADQLAAFTGADGAEDDIADCFGILGRLADEFRPGDDEGPGANEPVFGSQGFEGGAGDGGGFDGGGVW